MKKLLLLPLLFLSFFALATTPPPAAPDFSVVTSDGLVKQLYADYINQQKLVVIEAFFTTCPPCATHAPLVQSLYTSMQAAHPGKLEFILLSTLTTDTNVKVAQYKTNKGLTMPGVGKDGGSITALQPYLNGQYGPFQGTPTFIIIAPGTGAVTFDVRGNSPSETIALLQQKIEAYFPKICNLQNPFGTPLDNVQMEVSAPGFDTSFSASGTYSLSQVSPLHNSSFTLTPHRSGDASGVTTYDLVLISKHILAIEPFHCPWQLLAADVNCTGSITTFDIVTARQVILGILDSFPCGFYRFMPDSAKLSNGNCQDFVGIKLGDVNAGPCTDSLGLQVESRGPATTLYFYEHTFQPGETARVPLFLSENSRLEGIQCAFDFDPDALKVNIPENPLLPDFDAGSYRLTDQGLAISWLYAPGHQVSAESPIMSLDLTAPQGGKLSALLHLSTKGLASELYPANGSIRPLSLVARPASPAFSISPNPNRGSFTLSVQSEEAGPIQVQMLNLQGAVVFENSFAGFPGVNTLTLEPPVCNSGLYFLKVNGEVAGKVAVDRE